MPQPTEQKQQIVVVSFAPLIRSSWAKASMGERSNPKPPITAPAAVAPEIFKKVSSSNFHEVNYPSFLVKSVYRRILRHIPFRSLTV